MKKLMRKLSILFVLVAGLVVLSSDSFGRKTSAYLCCSGCEYQFLVCMDRCSELNYPSSCTTNCYNRSEACYAQGCNPDC